MEQLYQSLVDYFGTQQKAAQALSVDQTTVSGWVCGKWSMSARAAMRAERITEGDFTKEQLCPAVFADSETDPAA